MSRRQKALIAAAFSYAQTILGILVSLYITRFMVRTLGKDVYGTWLASGALLAFAALSDLGIFGVFPWLIAEADGKKDAEEMRSILSHGVFLGICGGAIYAFICLLLWAFFPTLLHLSDVDRHTLRGPIILLGGVTSLTFPLGLFPALRVGLQDYKFVGYVAIAQTIVGGALTVALAVMGFGLYALAAGTAITPVVAGVCAYFRTRAVDPTLLRDWPRFRWSGARPLVTSGAGQWLATLGWQLAFASDGIIIGYLGARDSIPMFVVTSRLGLTLMQFGWTLPDAALVGLAQLGAEGNRARTNEVVASLIRLHLLISGGVGCTILVLNGAFVQSWIGRDLFGGWRLNAVFALDIIVLTVTHALVTATAVLGRRVAIGILTAVNGTLHIVLALILGRLWGLAGVAVATSASAMLTSLPIAIGMLTRMTGIKMADLIGNEFMPWAVRLLPWLAVGCWIGVRVLNAQSLGHHGPLVAAMLITSVLGVAYLVTMKSLVRGLPLPERINKLLIALRIV